MQRRQYLITTSAVAAFGLAGCSGSSDSSGSNGSSAGTATTEAATNTESGITPSSDGSEATPTAASTDTAGESASTTTGTESEGLPEAPGNGTPGKPTGEFTTSAATTPMDADPFVSTLEGRIKEKSLSTAYYLNTLADEQVVELTYVASEDNQRKRLEGFAESFVETVRRAGGTGGWSLAMTVQTGASRDVWYTWRVTDEWAVKRLTGEISREEFYTKIEGTTMTPTPSG